MHLYSSGAFQQYQEHGKEHCGLGDLKFSTWQIFKQTKQTTLIVEYQVLHGEFIYEDEYK
jgi:hypothetical protein